jgi:hypothetical protein
VPSFGLWHPVKKTGAKKGKKLAQFQNWVPEIGTVMICQCTHPSYFAPCFETGLVMIGGQHKQYMIFSPNHS